MHVVQAVQVVNTPSTAPAKKKIESPISFSTLKVFHFVLILFFSFFLIFAWISFYDDLLFIAYSFHSIPTLFLLEWDWNMRLGGERLCIPRTYHNRSHNRERRPLVLGSAGTYEMGQFLYFLDNLRHPDVIYRRLSTHMSWGLAWMLSRSVIKW